jgi:hypothetical protein
VRILGPHLLHQTNDVVWKSAGIGDREFGTRLLDDDGDVELREIEPFPRISARNQLVEDLKRDTKESAAFERSGKRTIAAE